MPKLLDPTLDVVFKLLFAHPDNRDVLKALLTEVLHPQEPIKNVTIKNPEIDKENLDDKGVILDLLVELEDGRSVDVEMQAESRPGMRRRALLYWARAFNSTVRRGQSYLTVKPTILVWFLNYCAFEPIPYHSKWWLMEPTTATVFSKALELHTVELPKLTHLALEEQDKESGLVNWGRFMAAKTEEDRTLASKEDPMIRKAHESLERLSEDPETRALAQRRQLALDGYLLELGAAREEGLEQGRRKTLLTLLRLKFRDTLPDNIEERLTNATDSQIDRLTEKILTASTIDALFSEP